MTARTLRALSRLIALGAVAAAFVAAGPAAAADNPPVDANGKKSCGMTLSTGRTIYVAHGTTITADDGKQYVCSDGGWYLVVTGRPAGDGVTRYSVHSTAYGLVTLQVQATRA
jgi:hypothetical protein